MVFDEEQEKEGSVREGPYVRGSLSQRMTHKDNLWQRTWQQAGAIPVSRQKPLFDYDKVSPTQHSRTPLGV